MRAVVTGSEGFIGQHLVKRLERDGWTVDRVDDYSTHDRMYEGASTDAADYVFGRGVGAVFHLAGKVGPVGVLRHAGKIAVDTINTADNMANQAERLGIPMIDISTSEVYGTPGKSNAEADAKVFGDASPRQEYALAKLSAEVMLLNRPNLDVRIIRPFNVAGPGQRTDGGFVIPRFISQAKRGEPLTVYAPGTQRRAFTHVNDIIEGIMLAYTVGRFKSVYNLGNSANVISIQDLAQWVVSMLDSKSVIRVVNPVDLFGPTFREAPEKLPDASKAISELGWTTHYTLDDILRDALA